MNLNRVTCAFLALGLSGGCSTLSPNSITVSSATVIGVDVSQESSETPTATLGYKRAEFAHVPTNKGTADRTETKGIGDNRTVTESGGVPGLANGARDSANVLMELRYSGIFSTGADSGIYQRLAVGDIAVTQGGATMLFSKDGDGTVSNNAAAVAAAAEEAATARIAAENSELVAIKAYLTDAGGALDTNKRDTLITAAKIKYPATFTPSVENALKIPTTPTDFASLIADPLDDTISPLFAEIP